MCSFRAAALALSVLAAVSAAQRTQYWETATDVVKDCTRGDAVTSSDQVGFNDRFHARSRPPLLLLQRKFPYRTTATRPVKNNISKTSRKKRMPDGRDNSSGSPPAIQKEKHNTSDITDNRKRCDADENDACVLIVIVSAPNLSSIGSQGVVFWTNTYRWTWKGIDPEAEFTARSVSIFSFTVVYSSTAHSSGGRRAVTTMRNVVKEENKNKAIRREPCSILKLKAVATGGSAIWEAHCDAEVMNQQLTHIVSPNFRVIPLFSQCLAKENATRV
ncbi:hypothetical protein EI94DRAFT_1701784 [Lactarius quietus]|nr:hypothetical protein EI94DRAFT_1701784 [Lactarius quietus]